MPSSAEALAGIKKVQSAYRILATYMQLTAHLFMQQHQPIQDKLSVDYIVVGAGSSGAVIANRLTEDGKTTALLLEAGGDPPIESVLPGLVPYLKETPYDWNFVPQKKGNNFFKDNVPHILQGKMLGGTTSLNYLNYIRGTPSDYDTWAELVNDDSWRYENLLKYFKRSEDLRDIEDYSTENRKYHSSSGYIGVTKENFNASYLYLKAFQESGNSIVEDINGATILGYAQPMNIIDNGYRQSTGRYLNNKINRDNLILYRNTMVTKILFDDSKNAVGVTAINGKKTLTFYAKKEVIVAAGVFNSPKLLMLSQIGPKEELKKIKLGCISDLPIGKNLQFHHIVTTVFKMGGLKYEELLNARKFPVPVVTGTVAINSNSTSRDYSSISYAVGSELFLTFCAHSLGYKNEICDKFVKDAQDSEILYGVVGLLYPKSRGSVTLKSADYSVSPVINLGMLSDKDDLENLARYVQHYTQVAKTSAFKSVKGELLYLDLPGSTAEKGSLDYWKSYVLNMVTPFQSYAGTCSMGKVVDSSLRVYGVQNLRVADASVIPIITSGTMDIPAVMIGEKAADLIKGISLTSQPIYGGDKSSSSSESGSNEDSNNKYSSSEANENSAESSSSNITRQKIMQYIQQIMSELNKKVESIKSELDENANAGLTYLKDNIDSIVRKVEESEQSFLNEHEENGTYKITDIDLFVQNVVKVFKEAQVKMFKEIDDNNVDGLTTDADKKSIKNNISHYTETIVKYIEQKGKEIKERLA